MAHTMTIAAVVATATIKNVVVTKTLACSTRSFAPTATANRRRPTALMPPNGKVNADPRASAESNSP